MCIAMIIKSTTVLEPFKYLYDIIAFYNDGHVFTPDELDQFNFLQINGSVEDANAILAAISPDIQLAFYVNGEYTFDPTPGADTIKVWRVPDGKKWYQLINKFHFPYNIGELSAEEEQLLATYDIKHSSIASFINKVVKSLDSDPANNMEITDLRNSEPVEFI